MSQKRDPKIDPQVGDKIGKQGAVYQITAMSWQAGCRDKAILTVRYSLCGIYMGDRWVTLEHYREFAKDTEVIHAAE